MAIVDGMTAAAMTEIANASIVSGSVNGSGHLILEPRAGDSIDAGNVEGPQGITGAKGDKGDTGDTGAKGDKGDKGDTGNTGAAGNDGSPRGTIVMYAAASAPTGWALCDGSAVSRTTFAALFSLIGVTFGPGDGSTTFNLPNMQQRIPRQDTAALGTASGTATHDHALAGGSTPAAAQIGVATSPTSTLTEKQITTASYTGTNGVTSTGSAVGVASTNGAAVVGQTATGSSLPPYLNLNFIIKT